MSANINVSVERHFLKYTNHIDMRRKQLRMLHLKRAVHTRNIHGNENYVSTNTDER